MRVVVYEPTATGHHFAYLSHVMPRLAELASELILVTTPSAAVSPQFRLHLQHAAEKFNLYTELNDRPTARTLRASMQEWFALKRCIGKLRPDHVYVAFGDRLASVAGLAEVVRPKSWRPESELEVLLMRGGYQYPASSRRRQFKQWLAPHLVRRGPWSKVHHINPDDLEVLRGHNKDFAQRCRLMPDPIEPVPNISKAEARRQLAIPEVGRYIGCAGAIDSRKGMDLLLHAFDAARHQLRTDDRLLLAGPMHPSIHKLIQQKWPDDIVRDKLLIIDRHLNSAEMGTALVAMDLVCTPYPAHPHSSSLVIRAASAGRPVLGSAIGWMERTIARFGLGSTCDVLSLSSFWQAIVASLEAAEGFTLQEPAQRFVEFHSARNFVSHWIARIAERRGIINRPAPVTWDWVLGSLPPSA
jgi:glycosyltransferase involved in cell wall biosynthesis